MAVSPESKDEDGGEDVDFAVCDATEGEKIVAEKGTSVQRLADPRRPTQA